jgi:hypothetical protein
VNRPEGLLGATSEAFAAAQASADRGRLPLRVETFATGSDRRAWTVTIARDDGGGQTFRILVRMKPTQAKARSLKSRHWREQCSAGGDVVQAGAGEAVILRVQ